MSWFGKSTKSILKASEVHQAGPKLKEWLSLERQRVHIIEQAGDPAIDSEHLAAELAHLLPEIRSVHNFLDRLMIDAEKDLHKGSHDYQIPLAKKTSSTTNKLLGHFERYLKRSKERLVHEQAFVKYRAFAQRDKLLKDTRRCITELKAALQEFQEGKKGLSVMTRSKGIAKVGVVAAGLNAAAGIPDQPPEDFSNMATFSVAVVLGLSLWELLRLLEHELGVEKKIKKSTL